MEKYWIFRHLLDFMADHAEVVDADMNYYEGCMKIVGENDGQNIEITVTIGKKEEKTDA